MRLETPLVALLCVVLAAPAAAASSPGMDGEAALVPPVPDPVEPLPDDLLPFHRSGGSGDVPDEYTRDTSNYMIGSVHVETVLLESNGSEEPETENWTASRVDKVEAEIDDGLSFWASEAPARLSFAGEDAAQVVETGYEPIRHSSYTSGEDCVTQWHWIQDAMVQLGYDAPEPDCGDTFDSEIFSTVRQFAHDTRNQEGTDWAYVVFVVDSENDADGEFADGTFAYAYLGGPFTVMTYDNDGWGIDDMDRVAAHETGHIFGATDEYNNESESWGYLWVSDDDGSGCLMDTNDYCLSDGTEGQVGWLDGDGDGLEDPIDTDPDTDGLSLDAPPAVTDDPTLDVSGIARDRPYPAADEYKDQGFHSISVNDVTEVRWSVDGGATTTTATDAADPHEAPWSFSTSALAEGEHTLDFAAANQVGVSDTDPLSRTVTVDTSAPTATLHDPAPGRIYTAGLTWTENPRQADDGETPVVAGDVLYVNATASDDVTEVTEVAVAVDGDHVHTMTERPYRVRIILNPLGGGAPGTHTVTVEARDLAGNAVDVSQPYVVPPDPATLPQSATGGTALADAVAVQEPAFLR